MNSISKYLLLILLINGCGYYSFKGALPSHIKTVAIPLFENNTAYPNVRDDLTNFVVDAFIADNSLSLVDESNADLIITGTILSISPRAASVTSGETVEEYHMMVRVSVKCEDTKNNKMLWEKNLQDFGIMPAAGIDDDQQRDAAISTALENITEDILNNTLGYW